MVWPGERHGENIMTPLHITTILREIRFVNKNFHTLVSEKPPVCHNRDTMCRTKNRIPKCTLDSYYKVKYKIWVLNLQRCAQETNHGENKYILTGQKYSTTTKYQCTDRAIYRLNILLGTKMGIEIYR